MSNGTNYKAFLNETILGGNYGSEQSRNFQALSVPRPTYNARFFEAFPTAWAGAYAFQKRLELGDPVAVEEWAALFLLDNFAVTHLALFPQEALSSQYDKDLWPALAGTYPQADGLAEVKLLRTDNGTIIGAAYPNVIFFPSRGRYSWQDDSLLKRFLDGTTLLWEKCAERLLRDDATQQRFHRHLRRLPLEGVFYNAMGNFCNEKFGQAPPANGEPPLPRDPAGWTLADGRLRNEQVSPQTFLNNYPLKRKRRRPGAPEGSPEGTDYYLVAEMPQTPDGWMTTSIMPGMPSPSQYRKGGDREITVEFRGERIRCPLAMEDEVVELKDCFIPEPAMCGIRSEAHAYKVRMLHKKSADGRGICSQVRVGDTLAVLLAPVNEKFLKHFPEVVADPERFEFEARRDLPGDGVTWKLKLHGKEVVWHSEPEPLGELPNATLALWPPRVAAEWNLYIAYGAGTRRETGVRWVLVSDEGAAERNVELTDEEYASIIQGGSKPSRPRAMLLRDSQGEAAGVLFLKLAEESAVEARAARLAVDFGTSNTCLAYEAGSQPEPLKFTLSPEMLWGEESALETPGFVPFRWGGKDGFYSTILLSPKGQRVSDWGVDIDHVKDDIRVEHLVRVDIPSLHRGIEKPLSNGDYEADWEMHDDLKWDPDTRKPWRSLFLGLSLLYAHAEIFFKHRSKVREYVFTYPLAFSATERDLFVDDARQMVNKVRSFCYAGLGDVQGDRFHAVDESTAVAKFIEAPPNLETLELFIDTGGGTTDIALRYGNQFLVLDSIKVAGKTFFQFAQMNFERNMRGGSQFKKHLGNLLQDLDDQELDIPNEQLGLGTFYSLAINTLDDQTFRRKEEAILPAARSGTGQRNRGMGEGSFQRYRTRLFFQHMIAYGLLQACAAAVDKGLDVRNGVKLILGGNAWGLMVFAELRRETATLHEEASDILDLIKRHLGPTLDEGKRRFLASLKIAEVKLLNRERLSEAKTAVSMGALTDLDLGVTAPDGADDAQAYSGITIRQLSVNESVPFDLCWHDLWGAPGFRAKTGRRVGDIKRFEFERTREINGPNPTVAVFTSLGNSGNYEKDPMPEQEWVNINSKLQETATFVRGEELRPAPMNHLVSEMLYPSRKEHRLLNVLAQKNNSFENR